MARGLLERLFPKALPRSLWVFHTNVGGCNGCDIEVLDALTPTFDVERFGMRLVGSPRHADVLLVCGPVTRPMLAPLRALYDAVPDPKIVIAIGACAVGGGPWFDTYNVVGGVDRVIPVDMYVPGCPARPEAILHGVAQLLQLAQKKVAPLREAQVTAAELGRIGVPPGRNGGAPAAPDGNGGGSASPPETIPAEPPAPASAAPAPTPSATPSMSPAPTPSATPAAPPGPPP